MHVYVLDVNVSDTAFQTKLWAGVSSSLSALDKRKIQIFSYLKSPFLFDQQVCSAFKVLHIYILYFLYKKVKCINCKNHKTKQVKFFVNFQGVDFRARTGGESFV